MINYALEPLQRHKLKRKIHSSNNFESFQKQQHAIGQRKYKTVIDAQKECE